VREASIFEENLRNRKGLRRPLFKEQDFREMAIRLTTTPQQMSKIPGIDADKVVKYGEKFIPLIRQFEKQSKLVLGTEQRNTDLAGPSGDSDVVDLISDDEDEDDDEVMFDDDMEDEDEGETSHHFTTAGDAASVQAFYHTLKRIQTEATTKTKKGSQSASGSSKGGRKSFGKGKKSFTRRSSGASSKVSKASAGPRSKKASNSDNRKSASSGSARNFSGSGAFAGGSGGGGGGPSRNGGGISGIGLMRH